MATFEPGIVPVFESASPTDKGVVKIYETTAGIGVVPVQYILVNEAGCVPVDTQLSPGVGIVNVST